jgi:membrane associated rhomboid family serine protease
VTFAGGVVMTGVVTGLAAWLVAWIISAFVEKVNESGKLGVWNPVAASEIWFGVVGFLCALAAGALWYVLQLITPAPNQFYRWIVGLLLVAAVLIPILTYQQTSVGIETAILHFVIGLPPLTIIPAMGIKSLQR